MRQAIAEIIIVVCLVNSLYGENSLNETNTIRTTVHAHTLPPKPDKTLEDSTLLGIDSNNNGVKYDLLSGKVRI